MNTPTTPQEHLQLRLQRSPEGQRESRLAGGIPGRHGAPNWHGLPLPQVRALLPDVAAPSPDLRHGGVPDLWIPKRDPKFSATLMFKVLDAARALSRTQWQFTDRELGMQVRKPALQVQQAADVLLGFGLLTVTPDGLYAIPRAPRARVAPEVTP